MNKRLEMLEKLIAKGNAEPFVRYARALELRGLGELERALEALAEVRELHAGYVPTYLMAGQIAIELEREDEARTWLAQGLTAARDANDEHARSELQQALDALE